MVRRLWVAVVALAAAATGMAAVHHDHTPAHLRASALPVPDSVTTEVTAGAPTIPAPATTSTALTPTSPAAIRRRPPARAQSAATVPTVTLPPTTVPSLDLFSLFYMQPAGQANTLVETDWTGHTVRTIQLSNATLCNPGMCSSSPDGSRFNIGTTTYRSDGAPVGSVPAFGMWADDNFHVCTMRRKPGTDPVSGPSVLGLSDPAGHSRSVAELASTSTGDTPSVVACNVLHDRAVIAHNGSSYIVRLSDGAITSPPSGCTRILDLSGDGRLAASVQASVAATDICDLDSGATLAHVPISYGVLSGDGSLITGSRLTSCNDVQTYADEVVYDWRHGTVLFSSEADLDPPLPCDTAFWEWRRRPSGGFFVFQAELMNPRTLGDAGATYAPADVYLFDLGHGSRRIATDIAGQSVF